MNLSLLILAIVFLLIMARRIGRLRVTIWQAMTAGAIVVLATGQIGPREAWQAIDLDVMLFLFGMFVVGRALEASGYLYVLAYRLFSRAHSVDGLVLMVLFGGGLASALLMNDTLAIIGTPVALRLARAHRIDPKVLLLTLAFAITLGSVMSPIGNPQNLLIAIRGGIEDPFVTFLGALAVPTLLSLLVAYAMVRRRFASAFHPTVLVHDKAALADPALARLARASLLVILLLIGLKITLVGLALPWDLRLSWIALGGAMPLLLFSPRRGQLITQIDWATLIFFAALFVLMASVWRTSALQALVTNSNMGAATIPAVMGLSLIVSQLVSNVPMVALYLPLLEQTGATTSLLMALAAGSTLAGNLLILGAASNVIIIQNAERQGATLGFWLFARVGAPLTLINVLMYWAYLEWMY